MKKTLPSMNRLSETASRAAGTFRRINRKLARPTARILGLAVSLLLPAAYAAPTSFSVSGIFTSGATLSGIVTIDPSTGTIIGGDLAISGVSADYTSLEAQGVGVIPPAQPSFYQAIFDNGQAADNDLGLTFPQQSLVGYSGGALCGFSSLNCPDPTTPGFFDVSVVISPTGSEVDVLKSGLLTQVPEPATWLMMLSLAFLAVRRLRATAQ